ncbi:RDD family protein [Limnohabitans sp. 2KL-3]|uniref:RDD family protein n=1 Tax=Limnohabitans sp. 2KL-3 TaxID=1100700 RepID=UPI000B7CF17D|nr:RDD family protein [Limnohabitans sp. 2KL-3]
MTHSDPVSSRPLAPAPAHEFLAPSLKRRMACWLYEGMLLFGVMVASGLVYFIAASWITGLSPGEMNSQPKLKSGFQATCFLVLGLYFIWMWRRGQTLAMKTWRIEIVGTDGRRVSNKTALKRYLVTWIWFLPPIITSYALHLSVIELSVITLGWVAIWSILSRFHPQRQFWHDAWSRTRLITAQQALKS